MFMFYYWITLTLSKTLKYGIVVELEPCLIRYMKPCSIFECWENLSISRTVRFISWKCIWCPLYVYRDSGECCSCVWCLQWIGAIASTTPAVAIRNSSINFQYSPVCTPLCTCVSNRIVTLYITLIWSWCLYPAFPS